MIRVTATLELPTRPGIQPSFNGSKVEFTGPMGLRELAKLIESATNLKADLEAAL